MIIENWLSVGAGVFLIGMVLYGHYRGFLKQCVSLGALVLTIVIVKIATPYMTGFIKDNPSIRQGAADAILSIAGWEEPSMEDTGLPSAQRMSIERLNLPQSVKDVLLENNNSEIYKILGVDQFAEYVSMVVRWLDLIARLPILYGLNHIAGALLGFAQGLVLLWVAGFVLSLFSATPVGKMLEEQVYASTWLTFLYRYNLINLILGGIVRGIF